MPVPAENIRGELAFEHVCFSYDEVTDIIHDLSFHASPGQTIAIVGPTGAGKTTLVNLMMRFYDPQDGKITLDGRDIRKYTRKSLRAAFTMVLQDTWLFEGTIYENLAYGSDQCDPRGRNTCRKSRAYRRIHLLPSLGL